MKLSAVRVPSDLAGSGWYEILPLPLPPRVLEDVLTVDWVIVGAGFAGLTAASRLAENCPGDKIALLDAQRVGWGAAGRNSGFMIDLPHDLQSEDYGGGVEDDLKQIRMNRAAIDYARFMVEQHGLQRFFNNAGKINAATDESGLKALRTYSSHLKRLNEPFEEYSAMDLQHITGIDYYAGGIYMPGCVQIQPAGYVRGLAEGLKENIAIYENSPVLNIESGEINALKTPKGEIKARNVILTVNGHLGSFGLYEKQLMHVFTYASMTRELTEDEQNALGGEPEWGITPAHPMGSTVRRIQEGRIVVRNTFTYNPDMQTDKDQVERLGKKHDRSFRNRFPMLPNVEMEYRWGGHLCLSLNSVPVFGEIEENIFVACCQNGLGVAKGTLGGMLIADLATGRENPMVDGMLNYAEPKKLYPEPFMSLGAKSRLWWDQLHAGKDL